MKRFACLVALAACSKSSEPPREAPAPVAAPAVAPVAPPITPPAKEIVPASAQRYADGEEATVDWDIGDRRVVVSLHRDGERLVVSTDGAEIARVVSGDDVSLRVVSGGVVYHAIEKLDGSLRAQRAIRIGWNATIKAQDIEATWECTDTKKRRCVEPRWLMEVEVSLGESKALEVARAWLANIAARDVKVAASHLHEAAGTNLCMPRGNRERFATCAVEKLAEHATELAAGVSIGRMPDPLFRTWSHGRFVVAVAGDQRVELVVAPDAIDDTPMIASVQLVQPKEEKYEDHSQAINRVDELTGN